MSCLITVDVSFNYPEFLLKVKLDLSGDPQFIDLQSKLSYFVLHAC